MKKILSTIAILFVMTAVIPTVANSTEPCHTEVICGHIVVSCDFFDHISWQEIYCGYSDLD